MPRPVSNQLHLDDLDVLHLEARGQGLLELVRLVRVRDAQRVQILAAAHLELGLVARLLNLDSCGRKKTGEGGGRVCRARQHVALYTHGVRVAAWFAPVDACERVFVRANGIGRKNMAIRLCSREHNHEKKNIRKSGKREKVRVNPE